MKELDRFRQFLNEGESINEYFEYADKEKALQKDLENHFGIVFTPFLRLGKYSGDRTPDNPKYKKGYGSITFRQNEPLNDADWNKALKWIETNIPSSKITQQANYYDHEPGEKRIYPKVDFEFDVEAFPTSND